MGEPIRGFVLRPGEGRSIDRGGFIWLKASADDTGSAFSLLEANDGANFATPVHIHQDAAEAFYILEGEYMIYLEGRRFSCSAGSFIYIPSGLPHAFRVGNAGGRKLNLYAPAAMVGYFDEWIAAIDRGIATDDLQRDIAARYSMEFVGPAADEQSDPNWLPLSR